MLFVAGGVMHEGGHSPMSGELTSAMDPLLLQKQKL